MEVYAKEWCGDRATGYVEEYLYFEICSTSYRIKGGGANISVEHATAANEGTYTCLAVNEYGSDQSDVAVEVYEPAKFVRVPKDVVITSLETVDLDCAVTLDQRLESETEVRWLDGEGNRIILNEDKFSLGRENALVIKGTMKGDQASSQINLEVRKRSNHSLI